MKLSVYAVAAVAAAGMMSCEKDVIEVRQGEVQIALTDVGELPERENGVFTFRNVTSGVSTEFKEGDRILVAQGIYDISYGADVRLENGVVARLKGHRQSVVVDADKVEVELSTFYSIPSDDFIISEIFFAGTTTSTGTSYTGDDYIKLYNNTDHVLYADGLTIFESKLGTTDKLELTPDIMSEAMTVQALYTIPGSGREHPVQPGEYLLIADNGMDHRVTNPNSFDLSHADWEWYDVSTKPSVSDIDSPEVPNLNKVYCYTQTYWMLNNQGVKAYGVARIPVDNETYLKDYLYTYNYTIVTAAGSFPMSQTAYRLPNEWIKDVVNCSNKATYKWQVSAAALDMGFTWCAEIASDKNRFFKSVRRKVVGFNDDGTPVLSDTNNSTVDFNSGVTPSEIEAQGTAMDAAGNKAGVITWDGVLRK